VTQKEGVEGIIEKALKNETKLNKLKTIDWSQVNTAAEMKAILRKVVKHILSEDD
jgi:hypothetical protein